MTPDERINAAWANLFVGCEPSVELRQLWRDTINAATEEEREACAKIADRRAEGESLLTHITAQGRYDMAKGIAHLIRARSTASDRSAEPAEK